MYDDLSLASISAISAISTGWPRCLIGWRAELFVAPVFVFPVILAQRGLDQAGRDGVHAHALGPKLDARRIASS